MMKAARKKQSSAFDGPNLFGAPDQADLFGDAAAPKPHVPNPEHVRNRLRSMLGKMRASDDWPWEPVMAKLHRERTFDNLCDLLPDQEEAARWRRDIDAEIARFDALEASSSTVLASA